MDDGVIGKIAPPAPVNIRFRPRNGLVVVRRIRSDEGGVVDAGGVKQTKQGIYLSETNHDGDFFWEMVIVEVGRGIVLDVPSANGVPAYAQTEDLTPGMRVYVKAGYKMRDPRGGGIQTQETRSILQLRVPGDDDLYLCNQHDIFGEIIVNPGSIEPR